VVEISDITTPGACAGSSTRVITWRADDGCGNVSADFTATITVIDNTKPEWGTFNWNSNVSCDAISTDIPTATDNCDADVEVFQVGDDEIVAGTCANNYTITRRWRAEDDCGNRLTRTQTINVQDTSRPTWDEFNWTSAAQCDSIPAHTGTGAMRPSGTDNCSGTVSIDFLGETTEAGTCAGQYTLKRDWQIIDICGNSRTRTQTINVKDGIKPTWDEFNWVSPTECDVIPAHTGTDAMRPSGTDNCGGTVNVDFLGETTEAGTCAGQYTLKRDWQIVDACGNSRTRTQTLNVKDTTKPDWGEFDWVSRVECDSIPTHTGAGAMRPSATDNCDNEVRVDFLGDTIEAGTCTNEYKIIRQWQIVDACGNSRTREQTLNVKDRTKPEWVNFPETIFLLQVHLLLQTIVIVMYPLL